MAPRSAATLVVALLAVSTPAHARQQLDLKAGAMSRIAVGSMKRVAIRDPEILDARPVGPETLQIKGLAAGSTTLTVWRADGSTATWEVRVGKAPKQAPAPPAIPAPRARHVGEVIDGAHCGLPAGEAGERFEHGLRLIHQKQPLEAIAELEKARALDPGAARVRLYLGTAFAQTAQLEKGAQAYADFLANCPDEPQAHEVRAILEGYEKAQLP
jgi:tetratricopeptide (TPR) repeat protein